MRPAPAPRPPTPPTPPTPPKFGVDVAFGATLAPNFGCWDLSHLEFGVDVAFGVTLAPNFGCWDLTHLEFGVDVAHGATLAPNFGVVGWWGGGGVGEVGVGEFARGGNQVSRKASLDGVGARSASRRPGDESGPAMPGWMKATSIGTPSATASSSTERHSATISPATSGS